MQRFSAPIQFRIGMVHFFAAASKVAGFGCPGSACLSKNQRHGAVIRSTFYTEAPRDTAVPAWEIQWCLPFRTMAVATAADCFATAVVVGDQVIPVVSGIVAGTDPGNRRRFRTRWT